MGAPAPGTHGKAASHAARTAVARQSTHTPARCRAASHVPCGVLQAAADVLFSVGIQLEHVGEFRHVQQLGDCGARGPGAGARDGGRRVLRARVRRLAAWGAASWWCGAEQRRYRHGHLGSHAAALPPRLPGARGAPSPSSLPTAPPAVCSLAARSGTPAWAATFCTCAQAQGLGGGPAVHSSQVNCRAECGAAQLHHVPSCTHVRWAGPCPCCAAQQAPVRGAAVHLLQDRVAGRDAGQLLGRTLQVLSRSGGGHRRSGRVGMPQHASPRAPGKDAQSEQGKPGFAPASSITHNPTAEGRGQTSF